MVEIEMETIGEVIDNAPVNMNLMFVGDTGIGKTTVIENYCHEKKIFLKTLILSQLEASETLGIPVKSQREFNGVMYDCLSTAVPEWVFELAEAQNASEYPGGAMLFLDEFLCAQPSVMNAFLNFLTQKMVQGIDLKKVRVVAATNVGNYTFDPDNNILSRFCWFYTVNTKINDYLKDDRIINNYKDENTREGVLFEHRSLKPRCHEQLLQVDDEHVMMFYEGFTNTKYVLVHREPEINAVVSPYFTPIDSRHFTITDETIPAMVAVMVKTFNRFRKWDKVATSFVNIPLEQASKIKDMIISKTTNVNNAQNG